MFIFRKIVSSIVVPPYSLLLVILFGLLMIGRYPRGGRIAVTLSVLMIYGLSTPIVSTALTRSLEWYSPVLMQQLQDVDAIVILGGGRYRAAPEYGGDTIGSYSLERVRYGVRLQRLTGLPILVSGGSPFGGRPEAEVMAESIEKDFCGKVEWIENQSRDTSENASLSAELLMKSGAKRVAIVSHAWHLPRAVSLFEAAGLEVVPAPTIFAENLSSPLENFLPQANKLEASSQALREWLGLAILTLVSERSDSSNLH